jgi:penicillin amidase
MISLFSFLLLAGISSARADYSCTATYDNFNIPHLTVSSEQEYYYCFGLHHGKDRAWEMDYFRRVAQGRNAEVLGFKQLKNDLMMRLLDLPSLAQKIWSEFPQNRRQMMEWYTEGVNAGFKTGQDAREFKDLGYKPEPWHPVDSLMVLLIQSFDQTKRTFFMDYEEERMKEIWGEKNARLFNQDFVPWLNTVLKEGEYPKAARKKQRQSNKTSYSKHPNLWGQFPELFGEESGSNNWAVSKEKSGTGFAIFANDPHLDLLTPMFWYWIHIKGHKGEVIGASLPGVPAIPAGTNGKVAWGLTNAYINTADSLFVKDIPADQRESVRPLVWVKLGFLKIPFFFKGFERLKSGHRILPLDLKSDKPLVLRWTGFSLSPKDIYPMFDIPEVKNVEEMDKILSQVGLPAWNFVFADTKGDIGHRVIGRVYRQEEKTPFGIPTVTYDELKVETYFDPSEVPHVMKPKRHYVYTANNRHWPSDAAFYGGRGYANSFRAHRIDELLKHNDKHDIESFKAIQCDNQVTDAHYFVPKLMKYLDAKPFEGWDEKATDDSKFLPIYRRLMDLLMEKWDVNEYALFRLLDDLNGKQRAEIKEVFKVARQEVGGRTWGEIHRLGFFHLSKTRRWTFSPEIAGVGDNHTVNPGTSKWNIDRTLYEQTNGASMRMIIEMRERPRIYLTLPGLNRNYTETPANSPWMNWKNCQYAEVAY